MKIAIVGSRRRTDKENVEKLVNSFARDVIVISGGAKGVDTWAEQTARNRGLEVIVFRPNLKGIKHRGDMVQRYYDRNKKIAQECDIMYAFVSPDRKGGTENTIKYAQELGKKVILL